MSVAKTLALVAASALVTAASSKPRKLSSSARGPSSKILESRLRKPDTGHGSRSLLCRQAEVLS
jgi:hypothetical protein